MAVVTHQVAAFADGLVRGEIDLDDSTLRVRAARLINNSDYPAAIDVKKAGVSFGEFVVAAHATASKNIPAAMSVYFAMDSGDPEWGYPPQLTMADIAIYCRWPS